MKEEYDNFIEKIVIFNGKNVARRGGVFNKEKNKKKEIKTEEKKEKLSGKSEEIKKESEKKEKDKLLTKKG